MCRNRYSTHILLSFNEICVKTAILHRFLPLQSSAVSTSSPHDRSFLPWPSGPGRNDRPRVPANKSPPHRKKSAKNRKIYKNQAETTDEPLVDRIELPMFVGELSDLKRWNNMPNGRLRPSGRSNGCRNSCSASPVPFIISVRSPWRTGLSLNAMKSEGLP